MSAEMAAILPQPQCVKWAPVTTRYCLTNISTREKFSLPAYNNTAVIILHPIIMCWLVLYKYQVIISTIHLWINKQGI